MDVGEPPMVRPMAAVDIPAVAALDEGAGWTANTLAKELAGNRLARYLVLEHHGSVVAAGGLWLVVDEAHVVSVAVARTLRRRGYGRLVVHALLDLAITEGMTSATLECRASNVAAQALYRDYGFWEVGRRVRYYRDNSEDAVIMTTEDLSSAPYRERLARRQAELEALWPGGRWGAGGVAQSGT